VAFPTDTFYGLAVDPRSSTAVNRLFAAKKREQDRAIPVIAADLDQVSHGVGVLTPMGERLAREYWPGPLTLVIPASPLLCHAIHRGSGTVAVRVPNHPVARALARAAGTAVTSTSANMSGKDSPSTADDVLLALSDAVDVIIDAGATPGGAPSTIVDVTGQDPVLIRPGAIPWERVLKFLR
jgi:L-threonylcarbamoyladenylate synthase